MRTATLFACGLLALSCSACNSSSPAKPEPAPVDQPASGKPGHAAAGTVSRTGILRSGMMAIGGETTGWILLIDGREPLEVDVTRVFGDAQSLVNKRATLTGTLTRKKYVERGETTVLRVTKIEAAK